MRILVLSSKFPYPLKDGGAIAIFQIIQGLTKQGNSVHLLSFNTSKHFVKEEDISSEFFLQDSFTLVDIDTGPKLFRALINLIFSTKPYILERFRHIKFQNKLRDLLHKHDFDLVQVEGLYMLNYVPAIRENSQAKIAYRPHNLEHQIWELLSRTVKGWFRKRYLKILSNRILSYEKSKLNTYDMILPIAREDAILYQKFGNIKPLKIVPTGFDLKEEPEAKKELTKHRLFFIGSLEWLPNQEGLLWFIEYCWGELTMRFPNLNFYIAGRNAPLWLKKKLAVKGVVWEGEVESAREYSKDKSIMLVPLQSGSGMRVKIIEAFLQSKAVVATNMAARGTGATDGKHILLADDPSGFIEHIHGLIENRQLYRHLSENCYAYAKNNFNNDLISKELYEFYKSNLS